MTFQSIPNPLSSTKFATISLRPTYFKKLMETKFVRVCPELGLDSGALTPINQNAIKQGKCGNLECDQTERGKSEQDKAHISVEPDFAQTDFAQTELAKTMFRKSGIP
jgi:hypothetical protein